MEIIQKIKAAAQKQQKKIVLPEAYDERVLRAAEMAINEKLASIILIGDPVKIKADAQKLGLKNIEQITIVNPLSHDKKDTYTQLLYNMRKEKGMTLDQATKLAEDPLYLGCLMIKNGDADGEVAGSMSATSNVLKPALQILKTKAGINIASSYFLMVLKDKQFGEDGVLFYADCGFNINPTDRELAEIAITTASSAKSVAGIEAKIAMLSFSTKGSAKHEMADKVISATKLVKEMAPHLKVDGELQADAALIPSIAQQKSPGSDIGGKANILIFPNLDAGNIAYKLTQRLANAEAIGPIVQGLSKPVNDLSRGCSAEDIVVTIAITVNQACE